MRRLLLATLAALASLFVAPAAAQEQEEITNYASDITVARNGVLTVTETISVVSTGDQIQHGIYRDFPTTYTDKLGRTVRVRFDAVGATRDGHNEPYSTESIENGERVKIGDPDVIIDRGPHVYTLTYITDRQIGFFSKYDELYWNVTGNGWIFPIRRAEATIHLPLEAHIVQSAFYTGPQGAQGTNAESRVLSDNAIRFETTEPLAAYEGLTVAVGFSKGAVAPPSAADLRAEFIRDNASTVVAMLGVVVLLVFYLVVWWQHGRDPRRGVIVPLFAPPAGLSPEAVRFIHRMSYDRKSFAAALIGMAVKGFLRIFEKGGTYTLERTGKSTKDAGLSDSESAMADMLFGSSDKIALEQANHSRISRAISTLKNALRSECEKHYFVTNSGWFIAGLGILALSGVAAAVLSEDPGLSGALLMWISGWSIGTSFLVHRMAAQWADVISGPGSRVLNFFSALFASVFALPFLGALVFALFVFSQSIAPLTMVALVIGGATAYTFHHLLKAPTAGGAAIRDQIDGFRMFLNTAEKNRLEVLNPPNVTPEIFERFLPYAIALDCENTWSKRFEAEAAAAANAPGATGAAYTPGWYSGPSFSRLGSAGFVSSIGSSVANAAASASVAPGSSSGSGGGGSSGGGGGGGGGGGW